MNIKAMNQEIYQFYRMLPTVKRIQKKIDLISVNNIYNKRWTKHPNVKLSKDPKAQQPELKKSRSKTSKATKV